LYTSGRHWTEAIFASICQYEVTSLPHGNLQISNTSGPPLTSFKQLSNLDHLRDEQPQYRIEINGASTL